MKPIKFLILLAIATMICSTALAQDEPQVIAGEGFVQQLVWVVSSPTPGYCNWTSDSISNPTFHATNADGYGNMECADAWLAHCDNDSLVFQGSWPFIDSFFVSGAEYNVDLACSVLLNAETRMSAGRLINSGDLDTDEHSITVTYPDGSNVQVLNAGSGPEQVQLDLPAGEYLVTLHVSAYQHKSSGEVIDPYAGYVWLRWWDPGVVEVTPVGWNSLKAFFR